MTDNAKVVVAAAGFAVALGVATYLLRGDGFEEEGAIVRSSLRTSPDGVAGLSRSLVRLGTPTAPRMTPFADADPLRGTLAMLEPSEPPSPREAGALLDWVRNGGTLLYAPAFRGSSFGTDIRPAVAPLVLDSLGLVLRRIRLAAPRPREEPAPEEPAAAWTPHALTEGLPRPSRGRFEIAVAAASPAAPLGGKVAAAPAARPLAIDTLLATPAEFGDGVAAALVELGDGRIVVFASASPLSNKHAGENPLAVLAVRAALVHTAPGDTVFFDEFHHGVYGLGSPASALAGFLLGAPLGRTLLQLALAGLAALAFAGIRLGPPRDPPDETRRSPLDHAAALARLYERSGAHNAAALLLTARLARAADLPAPRNRDEVGALLRTLERRGKHESAVERVEKGWRSSPPDLVGIADGIDQYGQGRNPT